MRWNLSHLLDYSLGGEGTDGPEPTEEAMNIRESHWNIEMETKRRQLVADIFQSNNCCFFLQFYTTQIKHEKTHIHSSRKEEKKGLIIIVFFLKLPSPSTLTKGKLMAAFVRRRGETPRVEISTLKIFDIGDKIKIPTALMSVKIWSKYSSDFSS